MKIEFPKNRSNESITVRWIRFVGQSPIAVVVLIFMVILTVVVWRYIAAEVEYDAKFYFERKVDNAIKAISGRIQGYVDTLYGAQGLFAAHESIPRSEWRAYIESLDLQRRHPGIQNISFARYIPAKEREVYENRIRRTQTLESEDDSRFSIYPSEDREEYFPIEYIEPLESNKKMIGFDIGSDFARVAALARARDAGTPAATGRLVLASNGKSGFLIWAPIYRFGAPHNTVGERRRSLLGFVSATFITEDLMRGLFGDDPTRDFDFEIFDGGPTNDPDVPLELTPERLMYDDDKVRRVDNQNLHSRFSKVVGLDVAGRRWNVYFSTRPSFQAGPQERLPLFILIGGVVVSFSLFGVIWSLGTSRRRAVDVANAMTVHLRRSEEQYRVLFDKNPYPMWVFDWQTLVFLAVNDAAVYHYGYSREEFLAMTSREIRPPEEIPPFLNYLHDVEDLMGSAAMGPHGIWRHRKRDGTLIEVEISASRIVFEGRDAGLVLANDITDRRRAEAALSESQRTLSTLMSNLPGMAYRCRNDRNWTIEFVSEGCFDLTGYPSSDFIGDKRVSYGTLIHPDDQETVWNEMQEALRGNRPFQLVYRIITQSGEEKWIWGQGRGIFSDHGDLIALEGFATDITERKRAQEQIEVSREQLRNLSTRLHSMLEDERTRIAREVHDELGQLLTVLKMELSWLNHRLSKDQANLSERVRLMSDLVDMTIQTVRKIATELRPGLLDDLGLVAALEWQTQEFQTRTGIPCEMRIQQEEIVLDRARSTSVFRIFQEALTNIARHADADKIDIHLREERGSLFLDVSDNGKGIRESQISNFQSLGLLGMRERALLWGGEIEIHGAPGKGTTVTMRLPLYHPMAREGLHD